MQCDIIMLHDVIAQEQQVDWCAVLQYLGEEEVTRLVSTRIKEANMTRVFLEYSSIRVIFSEYFSHHLLQDFATDF